MSREGAPSKQPRSQPAAGTPIWVWVVYGFGILAGAVIAFSVLFTLGALRGFKAGCLLTVSDVVVEGEFVRISDEEMKAAVDQMTELALGTVTA